MRLFQWLADLFAGSSDPRRASSDKGVSINPATGLPMTGPGLGGVDVGDVGDQGIEGGAALRGVDRGHGARGRIGLSGGGGGQYSRPRALCRLRLCPGRAAAGLLPPTRWRVRRCADLGQILDVTNLIPIVSQMVSQSAKPGVTSAAHRFLLTLCAAFDLN